MPSAVDAVNLDPPALHPSKTHSESLKPRQTAYSESNSPSRPPVSPITPKASLAQLVPAISDASPPQADILLPNAAQYPSAQSLQQISHEGRNQQYGLDGNHDPLHEQPVSQQVTTGAMQPDGQHRTEHEQQGQQLLPRFASIPDPVPTNLDDNTDAAALRAALSILEIQKEKSRQDIRALQQLKKSLQDDPHRFAEALVSGKLREERKPRNPLQATFAKNDDQSNEDASEQSGSEQKFATDEPYPTIPGAQNVVRLPAINWAKYHIVGDSLDKMHEEQRRQPTSGEPSRGQLIGAGPLYGSQATSEPGAVEHCVLKPYDPLTDKIPQVGFPREGVQTRKTSGKG